MILLGRTCALALFVVLLAVATPASATATMECIGVEDPEVHVTLTLGSVPVLAIVNATIDTPAGSYAMVPQAAGQTEIVVGQGMSTIRGVIG
jgi:hypothetical protein